jgi:hypothetical protein
VFITVLLAQYCVLLLGTTNLWAVVVITVTWASETLRRLMAAERGNPVIASPSRGVVPRLVISQIVWWGVGALRVTTRELWFWQPAAVPVALAIAATAVAGLWTLSPLWDRVVRGRDGSQPATAPEDELVLSFLFFLLSGSLLFAAVACILGVRHIAKRLHESRPGTGRAPIVLPDISTTRF